MEIEQLSTLFKALSDPNRMTVFLALLSKEELCVCQITELLSIATATVSRHMSQLQSAGIVTSRKEGRWVYYRLSEALQSEQGSMKKLAMWIKESVDETVLTKFQKDENKC